ncbi:EP1-like glycoprotein 2 [Capsicum annuum]|nr:EP1-like glycoprotein 2 [Capsicum annuum]
MKLESNGHLKVYEWTSRGWREVDDLLTGFRGECNYPTVCGRYGICTMGQCSCPTSSSSRTYFRPIDVRRPNLGCSEVTKLTCQNTKKHSLLEVEDVDYFAFKADISDTDLSTCKRACLEKCSCKAAFFRSGLNSSTTRGDCYLPTEIFSIMNNEKDKTRYDSVAFIKVQV